MSFISDVRDYGMDQPPCVTEYISSGRIEQIKKQIREIADSIVDEEFRRIEDEGSDFISSRAAERAQSFFEKLLRGDEDAARQLFGKSNDGDAKEYWGKLMLTSAAETRRDLVNIYAEFLKSNRIKDLEEAVMSAMQKVREQQQRINELLSEFGR